MKDLKALIKNPDPSFIGGLFDAEGDCTVSKKRLRLTNKDYGIIEAVLKYLEKFGIKSNVYKRTKGKYAWYIIEIYNSHALNALKFLDLRHPKWELCLPG